MIKNSYTKGSGWHNNKNYKPMTITYNGITKTLDAWAYALECTPGTLREKVLKANRGVMSWDEAMMGPDERADLAHSRRIKNKRQSEKKPTNKTRRDAAYDYFLYTAPVCGLTNSR